MKRAIPTLTLAAGLVLILAALGLARSARAQEAQGEGTGGGDELAALRGAAVYAEFCQACHGPRGESIGTGTLFRAIEYQPDKARDAVFKGVLLGGKMAEVVMPPFAKVLDEGQIEDLLAYLHTWETGDTPPLPEPNLRNVPEVVPGYFGDPAAGATVYAKFCNGCHGSEGKGRTTPDFPPFKFSSDSISVVRDKHQPGFSAASGGPLSDQQLTDLETYLASWALQDAEKKPESAGYNMLLIVMGVAAIMVVGLAYMSRMIVTE